jgi:hypothetical protein
MTTSRKRNFWPSALVDRVPLGVEQGHEAMIRLGGGFPWQGDVLTPREEGEGIYSIVVRNCSASDSAEYGAKITPDVIRVHFGDCDEVISWYALKNNWRYAGRAYGFFVLKSSWTPPNSRAWAPVS